MADSARDLRLAEVLEEMSTAQRKGEAVDVDIVARQNPEIADELRELWSMVGIAGDVASICGSGGVAVSDSLPTGSVRPEDAEPRQRDEGAADLLPRDFPDYEILEELGRGGMGVVYKASQRSLGRVVALKAILSGQLAAPSDQERFRLEAQSVARLEHPNIVPLYEVGEYGGQPFFTMQYIEGTNLLERLARGPLESKVVAELLVPVCRAIEFAHRHGVLHRDLKPANILLEKPVVPGAPEHAYVTDFGLAKRVDTDESLTVSGAILGTPSYMSPEQASGQRGEVTASSDVYSLGAILYHALTGRPPFQAASPVAVILQVLEQDPLPPRLLNPQVDRDLEMIVLRCLQKPVDMRYPSAGELAADLEAYLADEPISARSGSFLHIVGRVFRETHHASLLENWGLLWMWHSLVLFLMCLFTNALHWAGVVSPLPYLATWTVGLGTWAAIFWALRRRSGPVTFVERQIAHVWGASVISVGLLNIVEQMMQFEVLTLTPILGLVSGTVFLTKAGILTGKFYYQAVVSYASIVPMILYPDCALLIFGSVSALCFFIPGLKYYRQSLRAGE